MKKIYILLGLVFSVGFILRFYMLGHVPVGLHTDEAYFGYNAFSLLKTAREITGDFLPLHFKSFLYSPALYSYFSIPSVFLFGLSEFSTRFASAFFGSITVLLVFLFSNELFYKWKQKEKISLIASLFFAISPWSINLSRTATENVTVVFFIILGCILFLRWNKSNRLSFLFLSFLCFLITIFTYQGARSFLPLFLPVLFVFSFRRSYKKYIKPLIFYFMFVIIPILYILVSPNLSYRIQSLSIFQNPSTQLVLDEKLRESGVMHVSPLEARIFHNKITSFTKTFFDNYSEHFSYKFLFTDVGLPDRYRVPGSGLLYLFDLPFIFIGIFYLLSKDKRTGAFLIAWALIAPIGSALTFDDIPNLQRTLVILPVFSLLSAVGFLQILNFIKEKRLNKMISNSILFLIFLFMLYGFSSYLYSYYILQIVHRPWYRNEGYSNLISNINKYSQNYKSVVITKWNNNPSIFLFFFNSQDPVFVQKIVKNTKNMDYGNVSFDKYIITEQECPLREVNTQDLKTGKELTELIGEPGILYVDDGNCKIPKVGVETLSIIKRNDGTNVFKLVTLN